MSKKVFVTTDLSANSRAGIRFGIQLAKQAGFSMIFFHALEIDRPTRWSDMKFNSYLNEEIVKAKDKLDNFVKAIYREEGVRPAKYQLAVERVQSVEDGIIEHAVAKKADFICMSTRGAGKIGRLLGTNTSSIIKHSPIPVLAIPRNYRKESIDHILYASDLNALPAELNKVKKFADATKSRVTVLHYDYLYQLEETKSKFEKVAARQNKPGVQFQLEQFNIENSLSTHLKNAVRKYDPSLVVLFTRQDRDWFDRLFLSSKSAEVSFDNKKPLLIFSKKG